MEKIKNIKWIIRLLVIISFTYCHVVTANNSFKSLSIYNSTIKLDNQDGQHVSLSSLQGTPVVAAMIFTRCQASCPLIMADLKAIEKELSEKERKKMRFALFSFDSAYDTPNVLKEFAQKHHVDLSYWSFFHGGVREIRELAALLSIQFKKANDGNFDHSNKITLIDSDGILIYQEVGIRKNPNRLVNILKSAIETTQISDPARRVFF